MPAPRAGPEIDQLVDPKQAEDNVTINKPSAAVPLPQQPDDWKITSIEEIGQ